MGMDLIITEKPSAAKKIAQALADGQLIKKNINKVPYYELTHKKKDIRVVCAVGHLYGLTQEEGKRSEYPVFKIKWVPVSETNKGAAHTKKYLNVIKKLSKNIDSFIVATDYDVEGEVIGLNVVRFACKQKDAKRMKFSTLTKEELVKSYENASKTLDWGQANAGETRHKLDWFYGINASRALTHAISSQGAFKVMSTGRVQGPALKLIVDKEKEISAFKPDPYWQIQLDAMKSGDERNIEFWHKSDKFWEKDKAEAAHSNVKGQKKGTISAIKKTETKQQPPNPFDLTSLQLEAHKCLRISPKRTLELAQELYTNSFISYPRTSSQQLPETIGYKKIITAIGKMGEYKDATAFLLKKTKLVPNNGKKTDPAHPAIYPTGIKPKNVDDQSLKLYDLIVRRFLATFGDWALRVTMNITLDCNSELFTAKGTTTKEKGWHDLYGKYVLLKEEELPSVEKGEVLDVKKIQLHQKETQPPKRFTEASIIKELEKRSLGTKATRANIIDTLFNRKYIDGKPIQATELGIRTINTLDKYSPTLTDQEMTRFFETEMDKIREGKNTPSKILEQAKKSITKIVKEFKSNEKDIGKELWSANKETQDEMNFIGQCPECKEGKLMIKFGKYGRFIGCDRYPECKTVFKIPAGGKLANTDKKCEKCGFPIVKMIKARKRPMELCLNPDCTTKQGGEVEIPQDKKCPKCGKDLIVRSSIYGKFLGCSGFPKCKYTEKL